MVKAWVVPVPERFWLPVMNFVPVPLARVTVRVWEVLVPLRAAVPEPVAATREMVWVAPVPDAAVIVEKDFEYVAMTVPSS
jgi:hypothetical protein